MPTLLIADDHPLFREALRGAVARVLPQAQLREAESVEALYALVEAEPDADLLLLDLNMPGAQGFSALVHLRALHPQLPIVVVSAREEPAVMRRALDHGAVGFIPKSADAATLGEAHHLRARRRPLGTGRGACRRRPRMPTSTTPRSACASSRRSSSACCRCSARGLLNKQIGYELGVSEATVKAHVTAILRKLGANNRTQAVLIAGRLALDPGAIVPPPEDID